MPIHQYFRRAILVPERIHAVPRSPTPDSRLQAVHILLLYVGLSVAPEVDTHFLEFRRDNT